MSILRTVTVAPLCGLEGHIPSIFAPGGYEQFFVDWDRLGLKPGPDLGKLENKYGVTRP